MTLGNGTFDVPRNVIFFLDGLADRSFGGTAAECRLGPTYFLGVMVILDEFAYAGKFGSGLGEGLDVGCREGFGGEDGVG